MKIRLTDFALRHFDSKFGGTKILNMTPDAFETEIEDLHIMADGDGELYSSSGCCFVNSMSGYAPFCKLLPLLNFTDAKVGSMPITLENYQYLRSGYSSRKNNELPVFSRWLDLPLGKPKAEWLILVLYDKIQLDKEGRENKGEYDDPNRNYVPLDADWGIVAILGQSHPHEEPMKPETMVRNAGYNTTKYQKEAYEKLSHLIVECIKPKGAKDNIDKQIYDILNLQGVLTGGSGKALDKEAYLKSCDFWSKNATVS